MKRVDKMIVNKEVELVKKLETGSKRKSKAIDGFVVALILIAVSVVVGVKFKSEIGTWVAGIFTGFTDGTSSLFSAS